MLMPNGFITVQLLEEDETRNGLEQLLRDVVEARKNGAKFTPEAVLYALDAAARFGEEK